MDSNKSKLNAMMAETDSLLNIKLLEAIKKGYARAVRALIMLGANVYWTSETGGTLLMVAASGDHIEVAKVLLNSIDPAHAKSKKTNGTTALMFAARHGRFEMVNLLIPYSEINALAKDGTTALMLAAKYGHAQVAEALLVAGADANIRNGFGQSALDFAEINGYLGTAQFLSTFESAIHPKNRAIYDKGYLPSAPKRKTIKLKNEDKKCGLRVKHKNNQKRL